MRPLPRVPCHDSNTVVLGCDKIGMANSSQSSASCSQFSSLHAQQHLLKCNYASSVAALTLAGPKNAGSCCKTEPAATQIRTNIPKKRLSANRLELPSMLATSCPSCCFLLFSIDYVSALRLPQFHLLLSCSIANLRTTHHGKQRAKRITTVPRREAEDSAKDSTSPNQLFY